jgi:hypothetical protein
LCATPPFQLLGGGDLALQVQPFRLGLLALRDVHDHLGDHPRAGFALVGKGGDLGDAVLVVGDRLLVDLHLPRPQRPLHGTVVAGRREAPEILEAGPALRIAHQLPPRRVHVMHDEALIDDVQARPRRGNDELQPLPDGLAFRFQAFSLRDVVGKSHGKLQVAEPHETRRDLHGEQ